MYRVATNAAPTFDVVMITEQQQPKHLPDVL